MDVDRARKTSIFALMGTTLGSRYARNAPVGCAIAPPEHRAITIRQLKKLYELAAHGFGAERWRLASHARAQSRRFAAEGLTHADVVQHLVTPATADRRCSLVELLASAPQPAQWYVIVGHDQPLLDTITCLSEHARDRGLGDDTAYWLSAYALSPHADASGPALDAMLAGALPRAMEISSGAVALFDRAGEVLTRAWFGYEVWLSATAPGGAHRLFDAYIPDNDNFAVGLVDGFAEADGEGVLEKLEREELFPDAIVAAVLRYRFSAALLRDESARERLLAAVGGADAATRVDATVAARFVALRLADVLSRLDVPPGGIDSAHPELGGRDGRRSSTLQLGGGRDFAVLRGSALERLVAHGLPDSATAKRVELPLPATLRRLELC
jgi:hypothetical protein